MKTRTTVYLDDGTSWDIGGGGVLPKPINGVFICPHGNGGSLPIYEDHVSAIESKTWDDSLPLAPIAKPNTENDMLFDPSWKCW